MLAGSNHLILLVFGALVLVGGLLAGYMLTRKSTAHSQDAASIESANTDTADQAQLPEQAPSRTVMPPAEAPISRVSQPEIPASEPPSVEPVSQVSDNAEERQSMTLSPQLQNLEPQIKHRIVYRFMPHLKGMLFEGDTLDGYLDDAVDRALQRGWSNENLVSAAQSGKWKKPRSEHQSPED